MPGLKDLINAESFLMKNKLLHIDMIELINRGCAEILFEADGEYLLRDMVSKVCFHTRPDEGGSKLIDLAPEDDTKPVINTAVSIFQKRLQIRSQTA